MEPKVVTNQFKLLESRDLGKVVGLVFLCFQLVFKCAQLVFFFVTAVVFFFCCFEGAKTNGPNVGLIRPIYWKQSGGDDLHFVEGGWLDVVL
jgi:hypothetical protein